MSTVFVGVSCGEWAVVGVHCTMSAPREPRLDIGFGALEGMGTYGGAYLQRANIARIGIGANLVEDALYPMTFLDDRGEPYDGSRS